MQATQILKVTAAQLQKFGQQNGLDVALLEDIIGNNADALGYMLLAYYPREKVSGVAMISRTAQLLEDGAVNFKLQYIKEEFNSCSAVNTEAGDTMTVTLRRTGEAGIILIAENWAEL